MKSAISKTCHDFSSNWHNPHWSTSLFWVWTTFCWWTHFVIMGHFGERISGILLVEDISLLKLAKGHQQCENLVGNWGADIKWQSAKCNKSTSITSRDFGKAPKTIFLAVTSQLYRFPCHYLPTYSTLLKNTTIEHSERLVTLETGPRDLWPETWHLRHWFDFWQLRTTISTFTLWPLNKEWQGTAFAILAMFSNVFPMFVQCFSNVQTLSNIVQYAA